MFDKIKNVEIVSILNGTSVPYRLYENRATHAFIFRLCGENCYRFSNKREYLSKREMIFIPKGTTYSVRRMTDESCYLAVNFDADISEPVPGKYKINDFTDVDYMGRQFVRLWHSNHPSDYYKCMSLFYDILSCITALEHKGYVSCSENKQIKPALDYLEKHIYQSSLRIESLYDLSNMSDTYFRKLFVAKYGIGPRKYIINQRLMRAKALIDSGEYDTIYEIADSVGYEDSMYFSKLFKKKYGLTPTQYREFMRNKF